MTLTHIAARYGKLLSFLRGELGLSSSLVKRRKGLGAFLQNGLPVRTDTMIFPGDEITVLLDEEAPDFPPEDGELTILYEDDALLALDKPPGLLMHPSAQRNIGTLANLVLGHYRQTGQACAVHPVSRLDRDTFGVVLLAKNAHIHAKMMAQLQGHDLQKTYEALVWGSPTEASGVWDFPIARRPGGSLLREVRADGQPAETRWQVLRRGESCTQLSLSPITGRTHQLRVHCAHTGCPILGDRQYGTEASITLSEQLCLASQQLCAVRLVFVHPLTGQEIDLRSCQSVCFPATP